MFYVMCTNFNKLSLNLLKPVKWILEPKRTTFVLKRTRPVKLNKLGAAFPKKLKRPSYYYELVKDTDFVKKPLLNLVLTKDVPGVGMIGETIQANCYIGYRDLLLPKLAVYADSPEAQSIARSEEEVQYSSIYSKIIENHLAGQVLPIFLSSEIGWTLQPWHVKFFLRKKGILVNSNCIILPEKKISGPDVNIENKDFIVKLIMNKTEKFVLRCRIYHCSNVDLPFKDTEALYIKSEPLFPEESDIVENLRKIGEEIRKTQLLVGQKSGQWRSH